MNEIVLKSLSAPFPPEDIEWRIGQSGVTAKGPWAKVLAYLTSRAVMQRLDEIVGPANWKDEYAKGPDGGVICGISILVEREAEGVIAREWVTKWDGAENSQIEAVKGGLSDAFKRAAVKWSIGRYLYRLEEGWATIAVDTDKDAYRGEAKDAAGKKVYFRWYPPRLPDWALPIELRKAGNAHAEPPSVTIPTNEYKQFVIFCDQKTKAKVFTSKEIAWKAAMTFANQLGYDHEKLKACSDVSVFRKIRDKLTAPTKPANGNVVNSGA